MLQQPSDFGRVRTRDLEVYNRPQTHYRVSCNLTVEVAQQDTRAECSTTVTDDDDAKNFLAGSKEIGHCTGFMGHHEYAQVGVDVCVCVCVCISVII